MGANHRLIQDKTWQYIDAYECQWPVQCMDGMREIRETRINILANRIVMSVCVGAFLYIRYVYMNAYTGVDVIGA